MLLPSVIAAIALVVAFLIGRHLRQAHIDRANQAGNAASGENEAMKNTLHHEIHDLGLGINQVQGYINALKGEDTEVVELRKLAQTELDKASALKTTIEGSLDGATTEAQIAAFATGLEQARIHVRKARATALSESNQDEVDD